MRKPAPRENKRMRMRSGSQLIQKGAQREAGLYGAMVGEAHARRIVWSNGRKGTRAQDCVEQW
eukprot:3732981-Pleurochrysis_carterae.AAC.1